MIKRKSWIAFSIVPIIIFAFGIAIVQWMFPLFSGIDSYDYDPAYQYLLNGVGILYGYTPGHVDHPGTPVQLLIGIVSAIAWLIRDVTGTTQLAFAKDVVAAPETYLLIMAYCFLTMNCLAIFYLGVRISRASGDATAALAVQSGYLLLGNTFPRFVYVSPEAMLIFSSVMLMAVMSDVMFADDRPTKSSIIGAAFFVALGSIAKVTFIPLSLAIWLFLDRRAIVLASVLAVGFAIVLLSPIFSQLHNMVHWYSALATHDGTYGSGNVGFMDWSEIPARLWMFVVNVPLYFAGLATAALAALTRQRWRGAILLVIGLVQLVLGVKHFGIHYVLPFLAICPVIFIWSAMPFKARSYALVASLAIAVGAVQLLVATHGYAAERAERNARVAALDTAIAKFPNAILVQTYHAYDEPYALQFGASSVNPSFSAALGFAGPDHMMFWYGNRLLAWPGGTAKPLSFLQRFLDDNRQVLIVQAAGEKITPSEATTKQLLDLGDGQSLDQITEISP